MIELKIVNAIRDRGAQRILLEIMYVDLFRSLTPDPSRIPKVAN